MFECATELRCCRPGLLLHERTAAPRATGSRKPRKLKCGHIGTPAMPTQDGLATLWHPLRVTLIVSVIVPEWIFQISDRRVSLLHSDGRLEVRDDRTNKAILYDGRVSIAATGLAELEGQRADMWIAEHLHKAATVNEGFRDVRDALTALFRRRPYRGHQFTCVAAGWARQRLGPTGLYAVVSNMHGSDGWLSSVQEEFWYGFDLAPVGAFGIFTAPAWMTPSEESELRENLNANLARNPGSLEDAIESVCVAMRRVASREPAVGRDLMLSVVPEASATPKDMTMFLTFGGIAPDHPTFFYLPDGDSNGVSYGPTFVMPNEGGIVTDFEFTPGPKDTPPTEPT